MDLLIMLLHSILLASMAAPTPPPSNPDCQTRCGDVTIPYPFGTEPGCYHDEAFLVTCRNDFGTRKLFLRKGNIIITNISVDGELNILQYIASDCYEKDGTRTPMSPNVPTITLSKFRISSSKNKFTAVGCATRASIEGKKDNKTYASGCMTICDSIDYVTNGSCDGIGCCQTSIPLGVAEYKVRLDSYFDHRYVWNFSNCSYAFVVEESVFNFSSTNLSSLSGVEKLPVVLDWAIGNETCEVANKSDGYACKDNNSRCYEVDFGPGYRCNCSEGYRGNPYVDNGCQDIDECNPERPNPERPNPCTRIKSCHNTVGSYQCSCPKGYHGDGQRDGSGCILDQLLVIKIALGTSMGVMSLITACSSSFWCLRRRKMKQRRAKYFKQNGGELLQQKLSEPGHSADAVKIFTLKEIEKATNSFHEKRKIGQGGFSKVYRGVLPEKKTVAVKTLLEVDQSQLNQFVDDLILFSKLDHPNVVKFLGCCLEEQVPLLVYEFIPNKTLSHHIHEVGLMSISWKIRLSVAHGTAEALSYLHSDAIQIIHRDVKSSNILLDENFVAKVSDFGASKIGKAQTPTMIEGTNGYLDPEYFNTSKLSDKSDVYSFGVVLAELLTGRVAVLSTGPEHEMQLSKYFVSFMNENRESLNYEKQQKFFDYGILTKGNADQVYEVAKLAELCLKQKGEERPTMKKVAKKLEQLIRVEKEPLTTSVEESPKEKDEPLDKALDSGSTSTVVGDDSVSNKEIVP